MRIVGLIFGALLASTSIAAAQTCPTTFAMCPPVATNRLNIDGPIANQQGVLLILPPSLPTAGQVLTATDNAGHTAWAAGGSGSLPTSAPLVGSVGGAGTVVTPANGLSVNGSAQLVPTFGTSANTFAQGNDSRIVGALQSVPAPTSSVLGGLLAATAQGGQFVSFIDSSGVQHFATPAGGGNVSNTGTPSSGQIAAWTSSTVVQGVSTISGIPISGATGAFTTLNATGNISQGGVAFFGSLLSTTEAGQNYYGMVSHVALDPSTLTNGPRNTQLVSTLTPSVDSSHIWENFFSLVTLNGPGRQLVEINTAHTAIIVNSGASFASGENYESSFTNSGTVAGGRTAFLDLYFNNAGATTNSANVLYGQLSNNNATTSSVGEYDFITLAPCTTCISTGSLPHFYYFLKNEDVNAQSWILGPVAIGPQTPLANTIFTIKGPDSSFSTFLMFLQNGSGGNILTLRDDGTTSLTGALSVSSTLTLPGTASGTQVSCLGLNSGNVVVSATCGGGSGSGTVTSVIAGTGLTGGTITTSGTIAIDYTRANTWTGQQIVQGPDNTGTIAFRVINQANAQLLSVVDNGGVSMSGALSVGTLGTSLGSLTLNNAGTGFIKLVPQSASTQTSTVVMVSTQTTDQVAMLGTNATYTAGSIIYSGANTTTFNGILEANVSTILSNSTVPTIASGFGTGPTIPNGSTTAWFQVNVGTGGSASSGVLTMPAAAHSWVCNVAEATANIATTITRAAPTSTTTVTLTSYSATTGASTPWAASDVLTVQCTGG